METSECTGTNRPYIIGRKPGEPYAVVFQPDCKQWNCPHCAERKKNEWFLRAVRGVANLNAGGYSVDFITLTSRGGKGRTRDAALLAFTKGWPRLRKKVQYRQEKISYMLVPEQHKNGIMHAHVLATNEQSKRWWKDQAYSVGLGYMVDVTPVIDPIIGGLYISKYIGKQLESNRWPKNFRRVRVSQDWPRLELPEPEAETEYEVYRDFGDLMWNAHILMDAGVTVDFLLSPEQMRASPTGNNRTT